MVFKHSNVIIVSIALIVIRWFIVCLGFVVVSLVTLVLIDFIGKFLL